MIYIPTLRVSPTAMLPRRAYTGDAGADVIACSFSIPSENTFSYGIGLAFAVPQGLWLELHPRSSIYKTGLIMSNGCGIIDSGYRGEVKAIFYGIKQFPQKYEIGDRVGQLIIPGIDPRDIFFVEVNELPDSEDGRGAGGFGSTGN